MRMTITDLRAKRFDIEAALAKYERIAILKGKRIIGYLETRPELDPTSSQKLSAMKAHPFFGMMSEDTTPVDKVIDHLRGDRYS